MIKMQTRIIENPCENDIKEAAEVIKNGGLVAFPTETVFGLGANALMPEAAKKIYQAKGRPSDNPLIIHLSCPEDAERYCYTEPLFYILAKSFMPGPLTVIMKKKDIIPYEVTGGLDTVAVRVPDNHTAKMLIKAAGVPIAAPSANISGKPSPTSTSHVVDDMKGRVDVILGGEDCEIGVESTIVKLDGEGLIVLRPGEISSEMLEMVCPLVSVDDKSMKKLGKDEKPMAPGMKYTHYSPKAKVYIVSGDDDSVLEFMKDKLTDMQIGYLCNDEQLCYLNNNAVSYGSKKQPKEQAKKLFAALRTFDKMEHIKTVYATNPNVTGVGMAVYNRLIKAAGFDVIFVGKE